MLSFHKMEPAEVDTQSVEGADVESCSVTTIDDRKEGTCRDAQVDRGTEIEASNALLVLGEKEMSRQEDLDWADFFESDLMSAPASYHTLSLNALVVSGLLDHW